MDGVKEVLNRLGIARIAAMAVVAVMVLGFFGFIILRSTTPQMAPLYTNLELGDSSAIVSELNTMGIPYELREDGATILIPQERITTTRMSLAGNGLPARSQMGYEIFDSQSALGTTSFVQNVNHVRALEGELARTISSLNRVASARVHLVLPERELFARETREPSASIVLSVRGSLSAGEIRAIQHLVASAIDGLRPSAVSIVDDTGTLLAAGNGEDELAIIGQAAEERLIGIENRMRTRIEDLLTSVVGAGRARVQVAAELDMSRSTTTSETFDPESQVVRSTQMIETGDRSSGPGTTGAVTVANELPGASENQGGDAGGASSQSSSLEETINYEISRITETSIREAGSIARLSVAVVVDGHYVTDPQGNSVYQPRSEAEIAQIEALVRSAMGFDAGRGDQLEVVNMAFAPRPSTAAGTSAPGPFDFTQADLMKLVEAAVTLLIGLALVLFVMRPLVRRVIAPEPQPLALPEAAQVPADYREDGPGASGDEARMQEAATNLWLDRARSMGEQQFKTLASVGEMVEANPRQATLVVRDWLNEAA